MSQRPIRLVLIDHSAFSLYSIEHELVNAGHGTPLFRRQIQAGGPITITHPDIIRYSDPRGCATGDPGWRDDAMA